MQLQTTSPERKFPNEYSDVIFIQIDQHLKKLLQKYKGVPILCATFCITESRCIMHTFRCPVYLVYSRVYRYCFRSLDAQHLNELEIIRPKYAYSLLRDAAVRSIT